MAVKIVWFRNDLRLADNPALAAATQRKATILPVFLGDADEKGDWAAGSASRWWLHQSLQNLQRELDERGSRLVIRQGESLAELLRLVEETGADAVVWNRQYEPVAVEQDRWIASRLRETGIEVETFGGSLLYEPSEVQTKQGKPFQAFTPFWKACQSLREPSEPIPAPQALSGPSRWPKSETLESLELEPKFDWAAGLRDMWEPGSLGAQRRLGRFLNAALSSYCHDRDKPGLEGTSRLSPHLHFGEISPRQVWHAVAGHCRIDRRTRQGKSAAAFLRELGWREFAYHVLFHFPHTPERPLRSKFEKFPAINSPKKLKAWQTGRTGYPIVDAGMRELWTTGWMHNRMRMVVGSFLTKELLIPWQQGARWFWDTLVDADLANNTLGWQWIAGCGADAAPYFRIFNPVKQGEKFDGYGRYVRQWIPELAQLPAQWIHRPWEAPQEVLDRAGIRLGEAYPLPIVDRGEARQAALEAFAAIKQA